MSERPGSVYDATYNRALASARLNYANVGLPFTDAYGERRCEVNGLPRTDRQLFELVWGLEEADRICGP
jgi:hypothetical protein